MFCEKQLTWEHSRSHSIYVIAGEPAGGGRGESVRHPSLNPSPHQYTTDEGGITSYDSNAPRAGSSVPLSTG